MLHENEWVFASSIYIKERFEEKLLLIKEVLVLHLWSGYISFSFPVSSTSSLLLDNTQGENVER